MMKQKLTYFILYLLICTASVYAQKKTFVREYTYQASEVDSKVTARDFAVYEMEKILLREVGEFLKAERKSVTQGNSQDYTQKIEAITAGIVEMKVLNEQWNGVTYYIKAEMTVDPNEVNRRIAELINDKQKTKELEDERNRRKTVEAELLKLKRELERTKNQSLQTTYQAKANELTARVKGDKAYGNQFYALATENYEEAAKKNQGDADMYLKMGIAYYQQKDFINACESLKKALSLNPNSAEIYYYIGLTSMVSTMDYSSYYNYKTKNLEKYEYCHMMPMLAFQKALTLKPNYADAYVGMGRYNAHHNVQCYSEAIEHCKKAIAIKPNYAEAYYYMAEAYNNRDGYESPEAKIYYKKAARLGSEDARSYLRRVWDSW
jgi:tetratricopeptide (TPR) repeat protein